jgi:hypothetical protein
MPGVRQVVLQVKKDAAPVSLRRPFIRLARTPLPPRVLELLRQRAGVETIVAAMPAFHARDPQGPWAVFHAEMSNAYARIMAEAGRAARVRKAVERAPEITVATNPYSARWIKGHASELAVELSQQQHDNVRAIVQRGYGGGARPEDMAAQLRRVVGLTSRQETAVQNFYVRAVDEDEDTADARTDRYAESQLTYRTEAISRTENRFAVEHGRWDEWKQARDDGEISDRSKRKWISAPASGRLCEICEALDEQEVGLDEPFVTEDGEEIECPPAHTFCRCGCTITVETD